jgi:peptide/nickel transport system substrate-binding protein
LAAAVSLGATSSAAVVAKPQSTAPHVAGALNYGPTGAVGPVVGKKIQGGTAYFQEGPSAPPTYIFPFISFQVCSTMNYGQLTYMLYRPLYWFGNNNSPSVDYNYSIGEKPVFTDGNTTVTVHLKDWKWSDGETVTSRDVEFWMNMMFAEKESWCDYTPGYFPDNIKSVAYPNSSTVVFHMNKAYNPTWFLYNELSQITPLPIAWDRTSLSQAAPSPTAKNLPDLTTAGVKKVYTFLDCEAGDASCPIKNELGGVTTYANSPLWSIVDGPWKVSSFTTTGKVTFVPNPDYSGSPKPTLSQFVEVPFTSDQAIINEIKSGGPNALTAAELPDEYIPQLKSVEAEGYNATNFTTFSFSYFPLNEWAPNGLGPVFRQLYFRQAFQHLVDAQGWLEKIADGYAAPTYGPVPLEPPNSFADKYEQSPVYAFSVSDAASILKAHGWSNVGSGGVATCTGNCGPGVPKGTKLSFPLDYQSGSVVTAEQVQDLKSQASQVGIQINLTSHPFAEVISKGVDCGPNGQAKPGTPKCDWFAQDWGAGWVYAPDFAPTGESLFYTGSAADVEGYSDAKANALIAATTTSANTTAAMNAYQNYIAQQVPVVFFPTATGDPTSAAIDLSSKHLGGFISNVYANLTPETWYLTK